MVLETDNIKGDGKKKVCLVELQNLVVSIVFRLTCIKFAELRVAII
jgi:hypothetical protein